MSVVQVERTVSAPWAYLKGARLNRRITATTPFRLTGPAAGSALVQTAADPSGTRVSARVRQLRRWHHAVGHGALRRGELGRLLQG